MVRQKELSKDDVRRLVVNCFHDLAAEVDDGWVPKTLEPDEERHEQLVLSQEIASDVREMRLTRNYGYPVQSIADEALAALGLSLGALPPARRIDLLDGTARAFIEQQRLYQLRVDDRLAPFVPADPLFDPAVTFPPAAAAASAVSIAAAVAPAQTGLTVGEAIDTYLDEKRRSWTAKTHLSRQVKLAYLRQHLGEDTPLKGVTADHIRAFRDGVRKMRPNQGRCRSRTFWARQTENQADQISPKTASLIFETAKAFMRWCKSEQGYLTSNPAEDIRITAPKTPKGKRSRRPFTADELTKLFSMPLFTGCLSAHRVFEPGKEKVRDARFWIPILGYYTGARAGELVQLHLGDIDLSGDVPLLSITEENSGLAGSSETKHVKSQAGVRQVPLHPDVLALGFAEFVAKRRRYRRSSKRLFPEMKMGADGQASTVFSKWFGRLMDRAGLPDPALVFHSFRHSAEDAFRNAGQQSYLIDKIIGHADGSVSAAYGEGVDLAVAHAAVMAMKLKVRLPAVLASSRL